LTIGKDSTVVAQSLTELNSQLIQARTQLADKESRLVALQRAQRDPGALGGITEVLANPSFQRCEPRKRRSRGALGT